jgi:hypothetical protein
MMNPKYLRPALIIACFALPIPLFKLSYLLQNDDSQRYQRKSKDVKAEPVDKA